jgi:hypothetical protein
MRNLLLRAFRPIPVAANWLGVVQQIAVVVIAVAGGTVAGIKVDWVTGFALMMFLMVVLLGRAAIGLQRDFDRLTKIEFDFTGQLEHLGWVWHTGPVLDPEKWVHEAVAWVWVRNEGPSANFAAQILNVEGPPWEDYFVAEPAWDGKNSPVTHIPKGHKRRIRLASILRQPRGFWFWTSEGQNQVPGWQWSLSPEPQHVEFALEVLNQRADVTRAKIGRITLPVDLADAEFVLEDQGEA